MNTNKTDKLYLKKLLPCKYAANKIKHDLYNNEVCNTEIRNTTNNHRLLFMYH